MDLTANNNDDRIRQIEDIIDIQKANGSFSMRQVAFDLPSGSDPKVSAGVARSLESGLTKNKPVGSEKKKLKKIRTARHKSPIADVVSWPSDSDITVLRMKLCLSNDIKEVNMIPGDGLHQPDGCSMVNLATLMLHSRSASKHSINIEEYLLPLTSWERDHDNENKERIAEETRSETDIPMKPELGVFEAICSRSKDEKFSWTDSENSSVTSAKSKIARFLRLYFCPCCSCLYNIENNISRDKQSSVCSTHHGEPSAVA